MPLLPLDKLQAGMRTAAPVLDAAGTLLVKQGAEVTAELVERLRNRKITFLDVLEPGASMPSAADQAGEGRGSEAALAHAFEKASGNEVMRALYECAVAHLKARHGGIAR